MLSDSIMLYMHCMYPNSKQSLTKNDLTKNLDTVCFRVTIKKKLYNHPIRLDFQIKLIQTLLRRARRSLFFDARTERTSEYPYFAAT